MADIAIETTASTLLHTHSLRGGVFWTSPTVGYLIFLNWELNLQYRKTEDGGANWAAGVNFRTGNIRHIDCWADWQTVGDAGTKIHIVYTDFNSDDVRYVYLDTSDDSIGGDVQIEACQGTENYSFTVGRDNFAVSITKTRGGNLAVACRTTDDGDTSFYSFYTSPDAITWTTKLTPWEATDDHILLFPGNEADNQDVWATFWDRDANEISLKTYDDSGNSWSEQSISTPMWGSLTNIQMDGAIRLSDGHLIFVAWNRSDGLAANLMTWDINGAVSITAKTNVLTDSTESFLVSVFVNQVNDDIYVAYASGTDIANLVKVFYQKSVDGGANWGGQQAMQADEEDDERWISAGAMKKSWGGKFQPVWYNADLWDLFTNTDNGISIAAVVAAITKIADEVIDISDAILKMKMKCLAETEGLADTALKRSWAIRLITEVMSLTDTALRQARAIRLITETVSIAETSLRRLWSIREFSTTIDIPDSSVLRARMIRAMAEVVSIVETLVRRLWSIRLITETIDIADSALRRAKSIRLITEAVSIADTILKRAKSVRLTVETVSIIESMLSIFKAALVKIMTEVMSISDTMMGILSRIVRAGIGVSRMGIVRLGISRIAFTRRLREVFR